MNQDSPDNKPALRKITPCIHEIDPKTITHDKNYGLRGICIKCGKPLITWRESKLKTGKVKMSKKQRLRLRRKEKESL